MLSVMVILPFFVLYNREFFYILHSQFTVISNRPYILVFLQWTFDKPPVEFCRKYFQKWQGSSNV